MLRGAFTNLTLFGEQARRVTYSIKSNIRTYVLVIIYHDFSVRSTQTNYTILHTDSEEPHG